jgi:N,N'-diacetyllegionaminate synthase
VRKPIFIIAEAGVNHNGDIKTALELIDVASEAGADAVKFQTFTAESLVIENAPKADYQIESTGDRCDQLSMLKSLELDRASHFLLAMKCRERGIVFLSTAFDEASLRLLEEVGVPMHKVASGEITNLPLLESFGNTRKPIILSTGMSEIEEVRLAVEALKKSGAPEVTILHCNTEYPTPYGDVNLLAMRSMGQSFGCPTGYSDHTPGIEIPIAAAALGAAVIEKHFTLDKRSAGPDHRASLDSVELRAMVSAVRNVEKALGDGLKRPTPSESRNKDLARKSIVARTSIARGELFTSENLCTKRPGTGMCPMLWHEVLGKPAKRDFSPNEMIET